MSPYSVRIRENTDQNNSEYRHFSRSLSYCLINCLITADKLTDFSQK